MKKKSKLLLYHLSKKGGARILLGLRKINEVESYWWMPGGSIEQNESGLQAGVRELKEELEMDTTTLETIQSYLDNHIYIPNLSYSTEVSDNTVYFIDIGPLEVETIPDIKDEFAEVKWFSIKELPANMSREYQYIDTFFSEKWLKSISQA